MLRFFSEAVINKALHQTKMKIEALFLATESALNVEYFIYHTCSKKGLGYYSKKHFLNLQSRVSLHINDPYANGVTLKEQKSAAKPITHVVRVQENGIILKV